MTTFSILALAGLFLAPVNPVAPRLLEPLPPAPASAARQLGGDHGRIAWTDASFDELLAEAARGERLVFLDFWADWCGWCKRLDRDVFADREVAHAMKGFVCAAIDKESKDGGALAARYGVKGLPTLLFLDHEGVVVDVIVGYLDKDDFLDRVRQVRAGEGTLPDLKARIAKDPDDVFAQLELAIKLRESGSPDAGPHLTRARRLIDAGEGYDPDSIDDHWRLANLFEKLADRAAFQRHMNRIRALDPEQRSYPLRVRKLQALQRDVQGRYAQTGELDLAPLHTFLNEETHEQLKFDAWRLAIYLHGFVADEARRRGEAAVQARHEDERRRAEAQAWRTCPAEQRASFGHDLAWSWYLASDDLGDEEVAFALKVAEEAARLAPDSATHLDTLACWLDVVGRTERAIELVERAVELEPEDLRYRRRLMELRSERDG